VNFSFSLVNTIFDLTLLSFLSDGGFLSIIGSGAVAPVLGMFVSITTEHLWEDKTTDKRHFGIHSEKQVVKATLFLVHTSVTSLNIAYYNR
jgi:hypothetical protein